MNYDERDAILKALECVDEVVEQSTLDPIDNLEKVYEGFPDSQIILFQGHQDW
jgi:glycerol-3-phosphate cytidylyltransferase-like family protein|tara:strand:- start:829 stop:987 length:159 start_codon:yes stop_codon:yes gene_type:complete